MTGLLVFLSMLRWALTEHADSLGPEPRDRMPQSCPLCAVLPQTVGGAA